MTTALGRWFKKQRDVWNMHIKKGGWNDPPPFLKEQGTNPPPPPGHTAPKPPLGPVALMKSKVIMTLLKAQPLSPIELEKEASKIIDGKEARDTIRRMISWGEIKLNDNLKLEIASKQKKEN